MELAENLKTTLDKTYELTLGLEQVSNMIYPRKIGAQGRKRLILINKEIKTLAQMMRTKTANSREKTRKKTQTNLANYKPQEIVSDSPVHIIKKR
jgi:hypothetical protein